MGLLDAILGTTSSRKIKKLQPLLDRINSLEQVYEKYSDGELRSMTDKFKDRLKNGETLDDILPEAFAVVREASKRTVGMRPFDVQILGGIVLHQGRIAEMKTGEGKTLVAVLPAYLNALEGKGVFIVTVNDYLAIRDMHWMGKIHRFLGLTVGCIYNGMEPADKIAAYNCDITYGVHSEFGFDYLRDNMCLYKETMVQRELNYAIVDEVDSILIDEARTPLIISGQSNQSSDMYVKANTFVTRLERGEDVDDSKSTKADALMGMEGQSESGDYMVDIKHRTVRLTARGIEKAEKFFGVPDLSSGDLSELNHHILQALKAHSLFTIDKDYVVEGGQVIIVDAFTGRLMPGRRYSDGLHQALEAKEKIKVKAEDKTLATITYQNYFRMFSKLAGMTGTAKTEEDEFQSIYNLDVIEVPTNLPLARIDKNDIIYATVNGKYTAAVEKIKEVHATGQPILVGTVSVEASELLSKKLKLAGVPHNVLNAKQHAREAEIVAQAGVPGQVTIATNMAGRGTDILLGGNPDFLARRDLALAEMTPEMIEEATSHSDTDNPEILAARDEYNRLFAEHKEKTTAAHAEVVKLGGLFILGTERHESRRIDNQLRGRSGRQGDPGVSLFMISLEDDLMKRFGGERMKAIVSALSQDETLPIEAKILSKQIESAQKRVEGMNFDIRKHVLQYDDVMNKMREIIYGQRRSVLLNENITDSVMQMLNEAVASRMDTYCAHGVNHEHWDLSGLSESLNALLSFVPKCISDTKLSRDELQSRIIDEATDFYNKRNADYAEMTKHTATPFDIKEVEKVVLLRSVDANWMEHIDAMDQMRQGIGLRAYGQSDPIIAYRNEGFDMFEEMVDTIRENTLMRLFHIQASVTTQRTSVANVTRQTTGSGPVQQNTANMAGKPKRNDSCPCGSGKKYKHCCGKDED